MKLKRVGDLPLLFQATMAVAQRLSGTLGIYNSVLRYKWTLLSNSSDSLHSKC